MPDDEDRQDEWTAVGENADNRTGDTVDERIQNFQNQLKNVYWYRIPLKYICNLRLVNTPVKFNTKWRLTFETNMQKLFESDDDDNYDDEDDEVEYIKVKKKKETNKKNVQPPKKSKKSTKRNNRLYI